MQPSPLALSPVTMGRKIRTAFLSVFVSIVLFAYFSIYLSRDVCLGEETRSSPSILNNLVVPKHNNLIGEDRSHLFFWHFNSFVHPHPDSILLPDWEVYLIVPYYNPSDFGNDNDYSCVFQNNATSPARFSGILPFSNRATFKCLLPNSVRRLRPFFRPNLTKSQSPWSFPEKGSESQEMFRWNFLTYESLSTKTDVILFTKGVNNRQGINRSPEELRCIFGDGVNNSVKTAVISSKQEVFRCRHPEVKELRRLFIGGEEKIKISIQLEEQKKVVPSVAYYTHPRSVAEEEGKSLLCACTMVYNVAKFLKEWVVYHSKIGVEKFILYDNGSDDDLENVVEELQEEYDVTTILWPWPKTQEAGFSHCAMYAKDSCTWMAYVDVDEFIFSPTWQNASDPSNRMLRSLLPEPTLTPSSSLSKTQLQPRRHPIGQISIRCFEFGPSNQRTHPIRGVTQGYTCRTRIEQRHKSIVLLDAIDTSLLNVIHHFQLKEGYKVKRLSKEDGVVNHYKYQAWSEFKFKFRRRVSAYVVDWKQGVNPSSKDRTPGLGFEPIEPKDWAQRFCEVHDNRLQEATRRWFGLGSRTGYKMAWQDE